MTAVPCVSTPLGKDEESITVYVFNMKHMSMDELERKLKEKEVELITLLDEEDHLRRE